MTLTWLGKMLRKLIWLLSLYAGYASLLNEIVCFSKLGTNASIFPIHYLYGWLGEYFDTHFLSPS